MYKKRLITHSFGFLAIIALMIASLLFGLNRMERVYKQLYTQSTSNSEISTAVYEMSNALMARTLSLRKILLMDDIFEIDQERLRMYAQGQRVNNGVVILSNSRLTSAEQLAFDRFLGAAREGTPKINQILDSIISGESITTITPQIEDAFSIQEQAVTQLAELSDAIRISNQNIISNTLRNHQQAVSQASAFLLTATVIALLTAIYVARWNQRQHKKIIDEREKYSALFNKNMDAVALITHDQVLECNEYFRELFFLEDHELPIAISALFPEKRAQDFNLYETWHSHITGSGNKARGNFEWVFKRIDGSTFDADVALSHIPLNKKTIIQAVIRDITRKKDYEKRIQHQATHDALTDLINRSEFYRQLEMAIDECKGPDICYSLCYIDLDQFKAVNDTVGHLAGDKLLVHLVNILKHNIRSSDILARLGGDEFALLLPNCSQEKAREITEEIRKKIEEFSFRWKGTTFNTTLSIGIATFTNPDFQPDHIINLADSACYLAKNNGRNQIAFSDDQHTQG